MIRGGADSNDVQPALFPSMPEFVWIDEAAQGSSGTMRGIVQTMSTSTPPSEPSHSYPWIEEGQAIIQWGPRQGQADPAANQELQQKASWYAGSLSLLSKLCSELLEDG